jgi:TRAP-type mannitol/chloroaromatic compound transport system substrate-binding protein
MAAVDKFREAGNEVYQLPTAVEDAIAAEADAFYEQKSAEEDEIFGKIYYSMKDYWEAYSSIPRRQ